MHTLTADTRSESGPDGRALWGIQEGARVCSSKSVDLHPSYEYQHWTGRRKRIKIDFFPNFCTANKSRWLCDTDVTPVPYNNIDKRGWRACYLCLPAPGSVWQTRHKLRHRVADQLDEFGNTKTEPRRSDGFISPYPSSISTWEDKIFLLLQLTHTEQAAAE